MITSRAAGKRNGNGSRQSTRAGGARCGCRGGIRQLRSVPPLGRYTVESSIYVAAEQRGSGVGTAILGPLVEIARGSGFHAMVAGIDATNQASLKLHAKFGFEQVAHFRQVGWKFERWLDLVFLERIF